MMTLPPSVVGVLRPLSFRGKARLLSPLVPRSGEVVADVFGYRVTLDLSDHIQRQMYMGSYEREDTAAIRRILRRGQTVLDVGANAGHYTLLASRCVGRTGRVVAVEPSAWVADRLARAVEDNSLRHVEVQQCALGAEVGTAQIIVPLAGNHTPSMLDPNMATRPHATVKVVPLDDAIHAWVPGGEPIALMKVDVEGFEPYVLQGANKTLTSGRVHHLLIEIAGRWLARAQTSPRTLVEQIRALGFRPVSPLPALEDRASFTHLFRHIRAGRSALAT